MNKFECSDCGKTFRNVFRCTNHNCIPEPNTIQAGELVYANGEDLKIKTNQTISTKTISSASPNKISNVKVTVSNPKATEDLVREVRSSCKCCDSIMSSHSWYDKSKKELNIKFECNDCGMVKIFTIPESKIEAQNALEDLEDFLGPIDDINHSTLSNYKST